MADREVCICLICGIPASGKTSLCKFVVELAALQTTMCRSSMGVVHICYDDIIPNLKLGPEKSQESPTWKESRKEIMECMDFVLKQLAEEHASLGQILGDLRRNEYGCPSHEDPTEIQKTVWSKVAASLFTSSARSGAERDNPRLLFLIDDNMFYRSMRYECFQLARRYSTGYCQIGLSCSVKTAISRNAERTGGVSEDTILAMDTKMELPDASKAPWEENSMVIDARDEEVDHSVLAPVWTLLQSAFHSPVLPLEVEDQNAAEQSRAECAASISHQADQILRKCISEEMAQSKDTCSKEALRGLALKLNTARTAILEEVKKGHLVLPPLPEDADPSRDFGEFLKERLMSHAMK